MLQMTMKSALNELHDTTDHCIYLYQDGETVFYVGRSSSPLDRLREHLGIAGQGGGSHLGTIITENLPASLDWIMEIYTLAECAKFVELHSSASLSYYLRQLNSETAYIEQLNAHKTDLEARVLTEQQWEIGCKQLFRNQLYDRLADIAEQAVIDHCSPCLNVKGNPNKKRMPDKYMPKRIMDEASRSVRNNKEHTNGC